MQDLRDLKALINGHNPLVIVNTHEESRILELFRHLVSKLTKPMFTWKVTTGLARFDIDMDAQPLTRKPEDLLGQIKSSPAAGVYILLDFHSYLDDALVIRLLKDIVVDRKIDPHTIVLLSHETNLPSELDPYATFFDLSIPDREQLSDLVKECAREFARSNPGQRVTTDKATLNRIVENLAGLPISDAKRLISGVINDDGALTDSDIPRIAKAKFDLLGQEGVLSFEYDTAHMADVGGLHNLKKWLRLRKRAFTGEAKLAGLDTPKGIMLLGVQGCGKSLAAKAVAGAWEVPLLRLDFGSLYNKYHGETEKNLRESLKTAETMSPCVLWVDEIEKAISSESNDGGTSRRVLGTLLTWMAENDKRVFIVATANDVTSLPPELLRKGRLDEIFFVDLPTQEVRELIFSIHLKKREQNPEQFDLAALAEASDGFSGSEIEQAVVAALYSLYEEDSETLTDTHIIEELKTTRPLSVVMGEKIDWLRSWGSDRAVSAG